MIKKIYSLLCILIALSLCSCGIIVINDMRAKEETSTQKQTEEPKKDAETSVDPFEEAKALFDSLPHVSYDGEKAVIAALDSTFFRGDGEESVLNANRISRIELIENKLETEIYLKDVSDGKELIKDLKQAIKDKEHYADVLAIPYSLVGALSDEGLLLPLNSIEGFDINADYFNRSSVNASSYGGNIYAIAGDGGFEPEKTYVLYYNKTLASQAGLDNIQTLVDNGEWTLERYNECLSAASAALDITVLQGSSSDSFASILLAASGFKYASANESGKISLNIYTDSFQKLAGEIKTAVSYTPSIGSELFLSGNTLFYIDTAANADKYTNSSFSWGMIPCPKQSADSEYSSYISSDAIVFCVPANAYNKQGSVDLISSLCALSYNHLLDDYITYNMNYVVRSNNDLNTLYTVLTGVNYDFALFFKDGYSTLDSYTEKAFEDYINSKISFEKLVSSKEKSEEYLERYFSAS